LSSCRREHPPTSVQRRSGASAERPTHGRQSERGRRSAETPQRTMRAAILHGKEDVRVEEVTPRALAPGEVRIRIEAALTCGTDLKVFKRGYHARMIVPAAVFGHELAGVICEVGLLTPSLSPIRWGEGGRQAG